MLEYWTEPFVMLDLVTRPDGYGGVVREWVDGAEIRCAYSIDQTTEAKIAYQNGTKKMATIIVPELLELQPDDRIKCMATGEVFRITSNARDVKTPPFSSLHARAVSAEVVSP